jgi:hypothetical protein
LLKACPSRTVQPKRIECALREFAFSLRVPLCVNICKNVEASDAEEWNGVSYPDNKEKKE